MTVVLDMNDMGMKYYQQGEYKKAVECFEQALIMGKNAYGEEHPSLASTLNNLAMAWKSQGDYQKAKESLEAALAIRQTALGDDHPYTQEVKTSLAAIKLKLQNEGE